MAPEFRVRPFDPVDGTAMADLHRRAILAVSPRFYGREERNSWADGIDPAAYARIAAETETVLVAETGERRIAGFCSFASDGETGQVCGLYTAPELQRRGIGHALLVATENALIAHSVTRIVIDASLSAVAFYERHGYQLYARRRHTTRGGREIEMRRMEKRL